MKGNEVYKRAEEIDYYYFEIVGNQELIKCLASFEMYLGLILYGMQVPAKCLGI